MSFTIKKNEFFYSVTEDLKEFSHEAWSYYQTVRVFDIRKTNQ